MSKDAPAAVPHNRAFSLETVGMSKIFGSLVALDDVSMKVNAGEFHALLGEMAQASPPSSNASWVSTSPRAASCLWAIRKLS